MSISKRIEHIRRQPEHIRLRWVWGLTLLFTFCAVLIWGISIKVQTEINREKKILSPSEQKFLEEFQTQKKSLQETTENMKGALTESQEMMKVEGQKEENQ